MRTTYRERFERDLARAEAEHLTPEQRERRALDAVISRLAGIICAAVVLFVLWARHLHGGWDIAGVLVAGLLLWPFIVVPLAMFVYAVYERHR